MITWIERLAVIDNDLAGFVVFVAALTIPAFMGFFGLGVYDVLKTLAACS